MKLFPGLSHLKVQETDDGISFAVHNQKELYISTPDGIIMFADEDYGSMTEEELFDCVRTCIEET